MIGRKLLINSEKSTLYKGGVFASPFLFIIFFSILFSQFGTENWLHPNITNHYNVTDSISYLEFLNNTHIGIRDFESSLNIYEINSGVNYKQKINNNGKLHISYLNIFQQIEQIDTNFHFHYKQKYQSASVSYINSFSNSRQVGWIKINEHLLKLSYGTLLEYNIRNITTVEMEYSKINTPISLLLSYEDFIYFPQDLFRLDNYYKFKVTYNNDKFLFQNTLWVKNSGISSEQNKLESPENNIIRFETGGIASINQKNKVDWFYYFVDKKTEFSFYQNSIKFLKINCFNTRIHFAGFNHTKIYENYSFQYGFSYRQLDTNASARLRTSTISNDLFTLFGAPIINNKDNGLLKQYNFLTQYKLFYNSSIISFNISAHKEEYDISLTTIPINSFGLPLTDPSKQKLNIIGKNAINLGFEYEYNYKSIIFNLYFDQQIPLKIYYIEIPEDDLKESTKIYGGGLFKLSIIKLF